MKGWHQIYQVVSLVAVQDMASFLEQINKALDTWYLMTSDLANTLFHSFQRESEVVCMHVK